MGHILTADLAWWLTAIQVPALIALFHFIQQLREQLAAWKLDVARSYASLAHLKDVEVRLTEHLVRIEAKLDRVASEGRG